MRIQAAMLLLMGAALAAPTRLWAVQDAAMQGFTAQGEVVVRTRQAPSDPWPLSGSLSVLSARTGQPLRSVKVADGPVGMVAFNADLSVLAWTTPGGSPGQVTLHGRTASGEWSVLADALQGTQGLSILTLSPDGQTLYAGNWNGYVQVWNMQTGQRKRTLRHGWGVELVTVSPDGSKLFVGARGQWDTVFDTRTWTASQTFTQRPQAQWPRGAAFSPDSASLALADGDGPVRVYELNQPARVRVLPRITSACQNQFWKNRCASGPRIVQYSNDGHTLMIGYTNGTAALYDTGTWKITTRLALPETTPWLAPDGQQLVTGDWGELRLNAYRVR